MADKRISELTELTTPADVDDMVVFDSDETDINIQTKRTTWANIKATLKSYFDTLYAALVHTHTASDVTDFDTEVSNNTDVAANTSARHTQNTDTGTSAVEFYVDTGGDNVAIKGHIQDVANPHSVTAAQVGAITAVVDDTTPQLGGELDAQANSIGFTLQVVTSSAGAATVDWTKGNKAQITLTEATTLSFTNPTKPGNFVLEIIQDATGGWALTLPTIKWAGGTAPTLTTTAGAIDLIALYYNGTDWLGTYSLNFS